MNFIGFSFLCMPYGAASADLSTPRPQRSPIYVPNPTRRLGVGALLGGLVKVGSTAVRAGVTAGSIARAGVKIDQAVGSSKEVPAEDKPVEKKITTGVTIKECCDAYESWLDQEDKNWGAYLGIKEVPQKATVPKEGCSCSRHVTWTWQDRWFQCHTDSNEKNEQCKMQRKPSKRCMYNTECESGKCVGNGEVVSGPEWDTDGECA